MNIKLNPIHTILVTPSQKPVNLEYITKDNYLNGVTVEQGDHLTVFSTGGFVVNAKASGDFTNSKNSETIEASSVSVSAANGSVVANGSQTFTARNLTTGDQEIIKSTLGGRDRKFNITYKGAGADAYIDKFDKDGGSEGAVNVYSATVTYTILAD
ncbi:MAG: hypothetical protein LRY55_08670 [Leadbetterella sp.]|nr:hypothetical protein [Leadbetterella sp.]